jgi:Fe-S-cluster containining protein
MELVRDRPIVAWNCHVKDCNQCGKCCIRYGGGGLTATAGEIDWWENHRPDIFSHVRDGDIWMDPVTGKQMMYCPWLEKLPNQQKYTCRIYFDRPDECKHYPVRIEEMIRDGCEMLEARDLRNQKQAQKALDKLMSDSRPPVTGP